MQPEEPGFPAAPWALHGEAIVVLKLVPKDLARRFVPERAPLLSVWPGHALAMLYIAQYHGSPTGEYREVILAPAMIWRKGRIGFWISHIFVDNDLALGAGRAIWALPKQPAWMRWSSLRPTRHVQTHVSVGGASLSLRAAFVPPARTVRLPLLGAAMSAYKQVESWFAVRGSARLGLTRVTLETDGESGFSELGFSGSSTAFVCTALKITIGRPARY